MCGLLSVTASAAANAPVTSRVLAPCTRRRHTGDVMMLAHGGHQRSTASDLFNEPCPRPHIRLSATSGQLRLWRPPEGSYYSTSPATRIPQETKHVSWGFSQFSIRERRCHAQSPSASGTCHLQRWPHSLYGDSGRRASRSARRAEEHRFLRPGER